MQYIKIDSDYWNDINKVWFVHEYTTRENSTAVTLTLKTPRQVKLKQE